MVDTVLYLRSNNDWHFQDDRGMNFGDNLPNIYSFIILWQDLDG